MPNKSTTNNIKALKVLKRVHGVSAALAEEAARLEELNRQCCRQRRRVRRRAAEELALLITFDGLTRVRNRRTFDADLEVELARWLRTQRPFTLVLIDLDHFKNYNDTFGHVAGDDLLREVGLILNSDLRKLDKAARFGGEEFALLLPDQDGAAARVTVERLRAEIARCSAATPVTASFGLATCPDHGFSAGELTMAADRGLYMAKDAGRNCVMSIAPMTLSINV